MNCFLICVTLVLTLHGTEAKSVPANDIDPDFTSKVHILIDESINITRKQVDPIWNETLLVTHEQRYPGWKGWFGKKITVVTNYRNIQIHGLKNVIRLGTVMLDKDHTDNDQVKFNFKSYTLSMDGESSFFNTTKETLARGIIHSVDKSVVLTYIPDSSINELIVTNVTAVPITFKVVIKSGSSVNEKNLVSATIIQMTPLLRKMTHQATKIMLSCIDVEPLKDALGEYLKNKTIF